MSTPDIIETERLLLRAWRDDDREPYARMLADPEFNRFMPGPCGRSEADARFDRIQKRAETNGFGPWAVEIPRQERFIGCTGLTIPRVELPFSPCVEIGWHLLPEFWGHGYATESARASMQFGFKHLALEEIVSFTVPDNVSSQRVMEKIGMTRDVDGDFEHPALAEGHPLRAHVLYRITCP